MFDLYSGEKIKGKTKRDRELQLFNSRSNMLSYIRENPDKAKEIIYKLFENRKIQKNLKWAPSTVELKSSILPTVDFINKYKLNYDDICNNTGLTKKYNYELKYTGLNNADFNIIQDSREQNPLIFENCKVDVKTLNFGDYYCQLKPNLVIERKSLIDYVSTISRGYDRFKKELERASENDNYIIMMVESSLGKALSFNYLPHMKWSQASPEFIFSRTRDLLQNYNNFQIAFVDGRAEMSRIIKKIFNYDGDISHVDLQFTINNKSI